MALFDAVVYAFAETLAYVVGVITRRTFHIDPKKAQRIGEYFVIAIFGAIFAAMIIATFVYS